jgi:hypothetical protein
METEFNSGTAVFTLLPSSATQVKRRIRKMSYRFVIEGSDLFYLEKDKLSE